MSKKPLFWIVVVVVIIVIIWAFLYFFAYPPTPLPSVSTNTPTSTNSAVTTGPGAGGATTTLMGPGNSFSFDYPSQFTVSAGNSSTTQWMQNTTVPGTILAQVTMPPSLQPNTNFQGATFTVGTSNKSSAVSNCLVQKNGNASSSVVTINGTSFTRITYGDAGAGNFYDIVSYRTVHDNACYALEYVIHSTNIQNYPPGTITQFDQSSVQSMLESMVQSFRFM